MTDTTPVYGFPLPSDASRISALPWHLRALSRTLEDKLPGAVSSAVTADANSARAQVEAAIGAGIQYRIDRNIWPLSTGGGWIPAAAGASTVSVTSSPEMYARSTVGTALQAGGYHGIMSQTRPSLAAGAYPTVWIHAQVRVSSPADVVIWVQWLTGTAAAGTSPTTIRHSVGTSWQWITVPAVSVPAAADNMRVTVVSYGGQAGATLDVRHVGLITSDGGYFDGGTADTTDRDHSWDGAAGQSTSTRATRYLVGLNGKTLLGLIGDQDAILSEMQADVTEQGAAVEQARADVAALSSAVGAAATAVPVTPPPGFTLRRLALPRVLVDGTRLVCDVEQSIKARRPTGPTLWASATGTAGAAGTEAAPTTLADARARLTAGGGTIMLQPGEYRAAAAAVPGMVNASIAYVAAGPGVRLTGWSEPLSWTLASGAGATAVYAASRSAVASVADPRLEWGDDGALRMYQKMTGTTADAVTAPGQWATDGTTVWVRPLGGLDMAASPDVLRVGVTANVGVMHSGGVAWVDGITIEGHGANQGLFITGGLLICRDVIVQGGAANGLGVYNGDSVAIRTHVSACSQDGFNYHESGGGSCNFIEVDCTSRRNGRQSLLTTCNGSTAHESVHGLRVGGEYRDTYGPLLADVNSSVTWTIGARTERADAGFIPPAGQAGHVHADGAAVMWMQWHTATGLGTAWRATTGGTIRVRDPRRADAATAANVDAASTLARW